MDYLTLTQLEATSTVTIGQLNAIIKATVPGIVTYGIVHLFLMFMAVYVANLMREMFDRYIDKKRNDKYCSR